MTEPATLKPPADPIYGKTARNGDERLVYKQYVGVAVPLKGGKPGRLGKHDIRRLRQREQANRSRVRQLGYDAVVEAVDFVARCISQDWLCCICAEPMDPSIHGTDPNAITVEHDPAVSVAREHSERTVYGAHARCNHAKAAAADTPRAAKIKRVDKAERLHAARMALKALMGREALKRKRREEAKLKSRSTFATEQPVRSGRGIRGRGFDKRLRKRMNGKVEVRT
jgi:hypothetical protein